jgi:hypothetical protein
VVPKIRVVTAVRTVKVIEPDYFKHLDSPGTGKNRRLPAAQRPRISDRGHAGKAVFSLKKLTQVHGTWHGTWLVGAGGNVAEKRRVTGGGFS